MKTILRINCVLWLLCAAGCSTSSTLDFGQTGSEIHSIAYLKSLCPANGSQTLRQTVTIQGTVIANDLFGEYRKSIVIQDATGGIEISVDHANLAKRLPLDARIEVSCNGLAVGDYGGKVLLGAPSSGEYTVDRIPASDLERCIRTVESVDAPRHPTKITFGQITLQHADTYVRFEGVQFEEQGLPWCDTDPETGDRIPTNRTLTDASGAHFIVRTLGSSLYAAELLPQGIGSINGIIDYFNGEFSLHVVNAETDFPR